MKFALKSNPKRKFVVYGIYWATWHEKLQRYLLSFDDPESGGGLNVYAEGEVDVVDPSLDHYIMSKDNNGMDMFVHKAAYPSEEFFMELVDGGVREKVEIVFQNMRDLGLEPYFNES